MVVTAPQHRIVDEARRRHRALPGATPLQGGVPIILDGKVIGAIGLSGESPQEDEGVAKAGAPAVGVAQSKDEFTAKQVFQRAQLSTVDDIDLDAGKLALAIVLSQPASRADYGVNASDLLPPVTPVLTPSG